MIRYILKRILLLIPVIIFVSFIVFGLMELAPGTPIDGLITEHMTAEDIQALYEAFNLHRPMIYRYGVYMLNLIQGDLGVSELTGTSVWSEYIQRLPNTLVLSLSALVIGAAISIPMGVVAARKAGKLTDNVLTTFTLMGISMPNFWLGLMLLLIFAQGLEWFPAGGNLEGLRSLILPAICSGFLLMGTSSRQARSSMLEVLKADYLRTARAKGVPEKTVVRKHALGNAWIPIVTTIGTSLSIQLAGSAVIETVFSWPGVGRMTVDAVLARDVTTTTGTIIMTTIIYVILLLIVDLLYAFIDPRIKAQYSGGRRKKKSSAQRPAGAPVGAAAGNMSAAIAIEDDEQIAVAEETAGAVSAVQAEAALEYGTEDVTKEEAAPAYYKSFVTIEKPGEQKSDTQSASDVMSQFKKRSRLAEIFHNMSKNKGAMAGLILTGVLFLIFIVSLFISFDSVTASNILYRFTPPNAQFLFGTDNMGRDLFLRTIFGTRYSIAVAFGASTVAAFFGILLGSIAGFYGKTADEIIMRFSDILASIPGLLLGMVIVVVLGNSLTNLIIAVGVAAIPIFLRITRASILTVRNQEFVEAAKATGISNLRILFTQVLPNGLAPIIVTFTLGLGMSIMVGASLSFLGFGVPVPTPEWGALISGGREFVHAAPWLMVFPGIFIMITVLAFNLLGDGLRDALDPKMKRK